MIETRHGRGFRFRAPVEALATAGAPPLTGAGTAPAVAVLPFAFAGDDPADALLADGIAEELAASLARLRWFPVIARESVVALRARGASPAEIAAEVDLACLVEGSAHRRGRDDPGQRRAGGGPERAATGGDALRPPDVRFLLAARRGGTGAHPCVRPVVRLDAGPGRRVVGRGGRSGPAWAARRLGDDCARVLPAHRPRPRWGVGRAACGGGGRALRDARPRDSRACARLRRRDGGGAGCGRAGPAHQPLRAARGGGAERRRRGLHSLRTLCSGPRRRQPAGGAPARLSVRPRDRRGDPGASAIPRRRLSPACARFCRAIPPSRRQENSRSPPRNSRRPM